MKNYARMVVSVFVMLVASVCLGGDWPQFRGPNRDGKSSETGLLKSWPEEGPPLAWKAEGLGKGFSSVSITGGKIFTMGDRDDKQWVIAVDLATRERLWSAEVGKPWKTGKGGPRCAPTVDGDLVFAIGTHGDLVCLESASGKERWRKNFPEDFGGKMMSKWGYSESPLVDGDKLLCTPGGKDAGIVALDKRTGRVIWKCAIPDIGSRGKDGAGYSSIVVAEIGGIRQYIQMMGRGLVSVAAKDGKFLWGYNKIANDVANIPMAIVDGDYVFCTTSYKTGSVLLKIVPTDKGLEAKEIYFLTPKQFENHHGGVVLVDGYLYGGDGQNKGTPVCLDMKTGKILWKEKPVGKGSAAVVYADGHLYFRYQNGLMVLAEANPRSFNVKGTFVIPVETKYSWPHPVILDGKLYLRDNDVLLCYDISLGEQSAKGGYSGKSAAGAGAGMEHAVVCSESGVFCGWPANNGVWIWDGKEILVGFSHRPYVEKKGHNAGSPTRSVLARSLDGGLSWTLEDPDNFVGDGGTVAASPGGIDFSHPDFAMRLDKGDGMKFFISYNRGRKWQGPYGFGDLMTHSEFEGLENSARTDYIVNGRHDCFVFMSARKPGTGTRDRAFVARTTDGGRSFKFISWINPEEVGTTRGAMPSTVRISKTKLVTALRRKYPGQWVDVFVSNDNGANWKFLSKVADTGGWNGNPPALARLKDGGLCCVYGNRSERKMLAKYSSDEGATWGPEIVLRDDYQVDSFDDPDLGYPRLVQRWDGKLVAMYYWATKARPHHHIAATIWDPGKIEAHADIPVKNVIVSHEPGRFAGWPANNGVWKWGNEILVGFHQADYVEKDCSHSLGGNGRNLVARSLDGGATWTVEDPENFAGDGGEAVPSPGNINFVHPDFAMRVETKQFFISYDRGRTWQGPYKFPDFGIGRRLTARTDYIVNGRQDCHIFLSAKEPKVEAALQDRGFCCRTTDGGKTFQFVSWMTGEPLKIRSVMPSTARCSSTGLVSAMRRRLDVDISGPKKMRKCWIDVYQSKDNGHTWEFLSQVADTGSSNGNPPSLVRLQDGRICVTYAYRGICSAYRYRWEPQGIRARISEDNGKTWGQEIVLRDDARTWDIGYTRSVQRLDGKIVTMYYYTTEEIREQHIAATIWDPDLVRG